MRLNRNQVKGIAMAAMALDHAAIFFFASWTLPYQILRGIGRISYPIFLVLFVEGFFHIKEDCYIRHLLDLLLLGIAAEPAFDRMLSGKWVSFIYQNVMFSWLLGFLLCMGFRYVYQQRPRPCNRDLILQSVFLWCVGMFAGFLLHVDYSVYGLFGLGLAYFYYDYAKRNHRLGYAWAAGVPICMVLAVLSNLAVLFAIPILAWYDSEKPCKRSKALKYGMYLFYPLHLWLLYILDALCHSIQLLAG